MKKIPQAKEVPFLLNFKTRMRSPKVPGEYDAESQIRINKSGQPIVEVTKGLMGTTRTGEHTQEC